MFAPLAPNTLQRDSRSIPQADRALCFALARLDRAAVAYDFLPFVKRPQVIVNVLAYRMSAVEAVSAPRVDCQSEMLDGESRIPSFIRRAAAERAGLTLVPNPAPYGNFALVQAIAIDPETGGVTGGADPRSGGAAMGDDLGATFTGEGAADSAPERPFQAPF